MGSLGAAHNRSGSGQAALEKSRAGDQTKGNRVAQNAGLIYGFSAKTIAPPLALGSGCKMGQ